MDQLRVRVPILGVTTACRRFESFAIQHRQRAATVLDQPFALQVSRSGRDTDATHTEHIRKELVRNVETVAVRAVLAHQQPARETRTDQVIAQARGRRGQLGHEYVKVAVYAAQKRRIGGQFAPEGPTADAPRSAFALHQGVQWHRRHTEGQFGTQHAFTAHHANFQRRFAVD